MISIDNTLISDDLIEQNFLCKLTECKGQCCVIGDKGAPLSNKEVEIIEALLPKIKPYMTPEYVLEIDQTGFCELDLDGEYVTTCQETGECNFVIYENGIAACSIEKTYYAGDIDFIKPVSCHLYPVRITEYPDFTAVNYHKGEICSPACTYGSELNVPVFKFVKNALIRQFGTEWYESLEAYASNSYPVK